MRIRSRPWHEREWRLEQAILPHIVLDDRAVQIYNVRDFIFRAADDVTPGYRDQTYQLDQLERVWCVLAPFMHGWRGLAHGFLSFGFADGRYLSISVEPRRKADQPYSLWKDAVRPLELMYVIGEERDLIGLRVALWDTPVYLYPIRATRDQVRAVFLHMLRRAQALEQQPVRFRTVTNNCITNIRDAVDTIAPQQRPLGIELLLAGYLDALAHRRGLIDTDLPLAAARTRFQVNTRARAAIDLADFSARIRAA
jgi:hypothetical protein